jgi:hypothetical protein
MTRHRTLLIGLCAAWLLPGVAGAQSAAPAAPAAGPLRIEPVDNGFVVAPDARFTSVNGRFATLGGVYGGWLTDRTLLVGAGAYWLANRDDGFKMQYFGGLGRWTIGGHRRLGVSAGALVGLGDATLSKTYGELFGAVPPSGPDRLATAGCRSTAGTVRRPPSTLRSGSTRTSSSRSRRSARCCGSPAGCVSTPA